MPLQRCTTNNKQGWRYGSSGKCYVGPGAKKKAIKQGLSYDKENFQKEMGSFDEQTRAEIDEVREALKNGPDYLEAVADYIEEHSND